MSYTKLAKSILTSTIWMECDQTRIVWLTLLAMADKNGEVQASIPGLANVARVPVEQCRTAIATFLAPDPDSRTTDDEGRRIESIRGGWVLINHPEYRDLASDEDRKTKAAERQQRARDKQKRNALVTPRHATSRQISQADAVCLGNAGVPVVANAGVPVVDSASVSSGRGDIIQAGGSDIAGTADVPLSTGSPPPEMQSAPIARKEPRKKREPRVVFVKPTVNEIAVYCQSRSNGVDPESFFDHYETNGWVQGNRGKPVRDWRACVRTWEKNGLANSNTNGKRPATPADGNVLSTPRLNRFGELNPGHKPKIIDSVEEYEDFMAGREGAL